MSDVDLLVSLLDGAGIRHTVHEEGGVRWAGFRMQGIAGEPVAMTAQVRGQVLQLVGHAVRMAPPHDNDLRLFNQVNLEWAIGRVYYAERDGAYDVSLGLPLVGGAAAPVAVVSAAAHLTEAAAAIRRFETPVLPPPAGRHDDDMDGVARALRVAGLSFHPSTDSRRIVIPCAWEDGQDYLVELWKVDGCVLRAHASYRNRPTVLVPDGRETLWRLQRLNGRLSIGAAVLERDAGRVFYLAGLMLDWTPIDGPLLAWLVAGAGSALAAIAKEYFQPA